MHTAALLIDLENFYVGRERQHQVVGDFYDFSQDLEALVAMVRELTGDRRLIVRRAYADFNARRKAQTTATPLDGTRYARPRPTQQWEYYLRNVPRLLMEAGIEPVQVFRFTHVQSARNAVDMRLAMDATALARNNPQIERFILVTGDSDFIPLVLELRQRGAEVFAVGVEGTVATLFERYCDRFELFESLLAATQLQMASQGQVGDIGRVRAALDQVLAARPAIQLAAVKPLLTRMLGRVFDPAIYGCQDTGEFIRQHAAELDLELKEENEDLWVERKGNAAAAIAAGGPPRPAHTAGLYRVLLSVGYPQKYYVVLENDWNQITQMLFNASSPADGHARPALLHAQLLGDLSDACEHAGMELASKKVQSTLYQVFKAGCYFNAEPGASPRQTDFHWGHNRAVLDSEIRDVETLRASTRRYIVQVLRTRLREHGHGDVQPEALTELFYGSNRTDDQLESVRNLLAPAAA